MALLIKNGEIITPSERYVADIFCEDETITRIARNIAAQRFLRHRLTQNISAFKIRVYLCSSVAK